MSFHPFSIRRWPAQLAVLAINAYQRTLSPDHGWLKPRFPYGACKYHPTCSMYTKEAIQRHGLWGGLRRGLLRIARCHPWAPGGLDPVT